MSIFESLILTFDRAQSVLFKNFYFSPHRKKGAVLLKIKMGRCDLLLEPRIVQDYLRNLGNCRSEEYRLSDEQNRSTQ